MKVESYTFPGMGFVWRVVRMMISQPWLFFFLDWYYHVVQDYEVLNLHYKKSASVFSG